MQPELACLILSLRLYIPRAAEEVNTDYATTTELADVLQREAGMLFRFGHHFASDLVDYGRGAGLGPSQLSFAEATRILAKTIKALLNEDTARLNRRALRR